MKGTCRTKTELIKEISVLNERIQEMERSETEHLHTEEALRNAEVKYRSIFENAIEGIYHTSPEGKFLAVNPAAARNLGYESPEELIKAITDMSTQVYASTEDRDEAFRLMREHGFIKNFEARFRRKDGSIIWGSLSAHPVCDEHGSILYIEGISLDINERKLAEEALRESEERFRAIANYTYDWENWIGPDGRPIWVNPAVLGFTGYSIEECYSMRDFPWSLIHEADRERMRRLASEALRGSTGNDVEFHVRCKNGDVKWASVSWQRIYDDKGGYIGCRSSVRDITDRRRMEEELKAHRDHLGELVAERTGQIRQEVARRRQKEEQYLALVESIVEWVWETDANFVHTYLSPRVHDVLGYKPEELTGRSPADIMPPEEVKRSWPLIRQIFSQKKPFIGFENVLFHKDGHPVFIEANGRPFFDQKGNLLGYRGNCRDITKQKKTMDSLKEREKELSAKSKTLEEVNAALKVLLRQMKEDRRELESTFVSNVREMVLPYIQIIKKGQLDLRQKAYLDLVATNLSEIISPFLNTIRQFNFTPKEIEISSLIKDGRTTKEIAELMGVAPSAIDSHRNNIRIKLGINNKKVNLRSHLLSLK
ncbi:MAG: PAS domain S-box protein [Syntrophorhabdaceae bacterium]|nr:PAS domain S-box protein [Syntrophorhabdaceae bacterium]